MHTRGEFAPGTAEEARERYERLGPVARTVVKETARAMGLDREEYGERVTPEVVETAREALFASLLAVTVGTTGEFDAFVEERDLEAVVVGSENVDRAAWHAVPFEGVAVGATFQNEEDAAVEALRRQVFGRVYRDVL